ncbi:MAG: hypothetical protein QXS16_04145 [Pyrobaculum sp.]
MRYYYRERKNDTKGKGESESNTWRDSDSAQYRAKNRARRLRPIEKIRVKKMDFFENSSNYRLLISSLQKRKMLLGPNEFNNISDYLLLKRYIRRIKDFEERDNYVVARIQLRIPINARHWRYSFYGYSSENREHERILTRYLIIGTSEENKFVVFFSDTEFDNFSRVFGFDKDIAAFSYIDVTDMVEYDTSFRVQGDLVLRVVKIENSKEAFINSLYNGSMNVFDTLQHLEACRRIADILSELSITSTPTTNRVLIEGCPKNLKIGKLLSFIANNLVLYDMFPQYKMEIKNDNEIKRILLYNESNEFLLNLQATVEHRGERVLAINVFYQNTYSTKISPFIVFFRNIVEETNLIENINEQEIEEHIGRHRVILKNAYPRTVSIEYEFPLSHRRYNLNLETRGYVTSGTEIVFNHPEHGKKVVKVPSSLVFFNHVTQPYRTTAVKNLLLLQHYFT